MSDEHDYVPDCECRDCLRVTALELRAECKSLRGLISKAAGALGNGAFISEDASVSFMYGLPEEIRKTIVSLKGTAYSLDDEANSLRAELAEARKDAARYRFLRDCASNTDTPQSLVLDELMGQIDEMVGLEYSDALDAAIDSAMLAAREQ